MGAREVSARTARDVADHRRHLAEGTVQAGPPLQRAAAYLLAMAQAPALVRWGSWWLSAWEGVWPSRVREALADAVALADLDLLDANERMGEALVEIGMALGLPRPTAQCRWGAPEILAAIDARRRPMSRWDGEHDVNVLTHGLSGEVVQRICSCGVRWEADVDECPNAATGPDVVAAAFAAVEDATGWRTPVGLVNDILIGCAYSDERAAVLAALAPFRPDIPEKR